MKLTDEDVDRIADALAKKLVVPVYPRMPYVLPQPIWQVHPYVYPYPGYVAPNIVYGTTTTTTINANANKIS